jgi:hypothetical protein
MVEMVLLGSSVLLDRRGLPVQLDRMARRVLKDRKETPGPRVLKESLVLLDHRDLSVQRDRKALQDRKD